MPAFCYLTGTLPQSPSPRSTGRLAHIVKTPLFSVRIPIAPPCSVLRVDTSSHNLSDCRQYKPLSRPSCVWRRSGYLIGALPQSPSPQSTGRLAHIVKAPSFPYVFRLRRHARCSVWTPRFTISRTGDNTSYSLVLVYASVLVTGALPQNPSPRSTGRLAIS